MADPTYTCQLLTRRKTGVTWETDDRALGRTITMVWDIRTDSPRVGPVAVVTYFQGQTGITRGQKYMWGDQGDPDATPPVPADPWAEHDTGAVCTSIRATQTGSEGMSWEVVVTWGTPTSGEPRPANPLEEAESLEWDAVQFERIVDADKNDVPILNSAGDAFDPPITVDDSRPTFTITRNEAVFDAVTAYNLRDYVNNATFFGWSARCVKIGAPKARRLWSADCPVNDGYYWQVTYPFFVNPNTWDRVVLDAGRRKLVSGARKLIFIDGAPAADPVPLNGSGVPINPGDAGHYKTFRLYEEGDFSVFGFTGA